jgi:N-acetylmuramic acid 6-phosphate etherase
LPVLEHLDTERRNPATERIDALPTQELLRIINEEDQRVATAVRDQIPAIARAVDAITERFQRGGRLFYLGAGTSGRLGVLDAAECPPTFGVAHDRIQALIAGGERAVFRAVEASEDQREAGQEDLRARDFRAQDALVGISASGRTPYVLGGISYARSLGALTVGLTSNPGSELARQVDIPIAPLTGPEVITGSTRMKSGTAQKLVLNMLSTGVMVRMGYVFGNLMVNLQLNNAKLLDRALRIIQEAAGCGRERAEEAFAASGKNVRVAILMAKYKLDCGSARQRLEDAGDNLGKALDPGTP